MKNSFLLALVLLALQAVSPAQSPSSAADLLTSGQAKEEKGDIEGALADYERLIRLRPDLAQAYFRRGCVLGIQGKTNAAVADYNKALELDPNMTDALALRANLLLTRRQDFAGSIADFDKLINLGVDLDRSYYQRGLAKARLRDFQGAIADYTAILELPPRETPNTRPEYHWMAYLARGSAQLDLSNFDSAIADFTAAISLNSKDGTVYFGRARAFEAKGEHESAQADYDKAVEVTPQLARTVAAARGRRSEHTDADEIKELLAPTSGEPKLAADYFKRGTASLLKNDYDKAIADFTKAIELDPKYRPAYHNRGNAFLSQNDLQKAIADYTREIELAPLEEVGYTSRANSLSRAGDLEGAIKDFSKAIELAPHIPHLYVDRGVALVLVGRDDEAKRDFERCLQIDPKAGPWVDARIKSAERRRAAGRK